MSGVHLVTKSRPSTLFGLAVFLAASGSAGAANDVLVPAKTPFGYNVGIDYETDVDGRTGRSITADLNQIGQYFELVRTYHDTANPNSATPTIDPNELQVIQYATTHPALSLVMGTYNSAVVTGTTGNFSAGLMDSSTYTDAWVQMLIGAFGSTAAVTQSLKAILLGNELDFPESYTPSPTDPSYSTYVNTWIPSAFTNLQASLSKAGLGNIPISVTLAYSPVSAPGNDTLSTAIPQYISTHWSASWNGGQPFVLYNQYSNSSPPTFNDITGYMQQVVASLNGSNEAFVGETGVQSPGGNDAQEAAFYQEMFAFLGGERLNGKLTLPVFAFQAFDLTGSQNFGLFSQDANSQPTGLKSGITIPCWVARPINIGITGSHDFNGDCTSDIFWRDTSGDLAIWEMNGGTILNPSNSGLGSVPTTWSIVGQRDFNGDGNADILWRDNSGNLAIWEMSGTTILNPSNSGLGSVPTNWSIVGTGDFNGDGKADILWRDTAGDLAIWEMNGTTILNANTAGLGNVPTNWSVVGVGDFNGDGMADILWRNNTNGNVAIWLMNGTTVLNSSTATFGNMPLTWSVAGTGDFNGDGNSDIFWRDTSGNLAIWEMNGTTITNSSATGVGNLSTVWSAAVTGDFNGDGKSDILWHDSSGDLAIWYMNGTTISSGTGLGTMPTTFTIQGINAD